MTDEQINKEIAINLGWRGVVSDPILGVMGLPPAVNECDIFHVCKAMWTKDLNAMHKAESILHGRAAEIYAECLLRRTGAQGTGDKRFFGATARQRAEALLMVLGKWEATTEESSADGKGVE